MNRIRRIWRRGCLYSFQPPVLSLQRGWSVSQSAYAPPPGIMVPFLNSVWPMPLFWTGSGITGMKRMAHPLSNMPRCPLGGFIRPQRLPPYFTRSGSFTDFESMTSHENAKAKAKSK